MKDPEVIREIKERYLAASVRMDERSRRRWAAAESQLFGWGGISAVSKATGISPNTIRKGLTELEGTLDGSNSPLGSRLRKPGAGRKPLTVTTPEILIAIDHLICHTGSQHSGRFIKWTCKTPSEIASDLSKSGLNVSSRTVSRILKSAGFSWPVLSRSKAILSRIDWQQRFVEINQSLEAAFTRNHAVIAISMHRPHSDELTEGSNHTGSALNRSRKQPFAKFSDQMLAELEQAIHEVWGLIDQKTKASKSTLLIIAEFFLTDPVLRRMEDHLKEELKLAARCLSLPPAIRKWNSLDQQTLVHKVPAIDHQTGLSGEMMLQVIGS